MFFDMDTQRIQYIKRYDMCLDFTKTILSPPILPPEYFWISWTPQLTDVHARIQYLGFRDELDALVFPSFRRYDSCLCLAHQIIDSPDFLPQAAWIIGKKLEDNQGVYCAAVQTSLLVNRRGQIHNIAVLPEYRGQGLGKALLLKSLAGFKQVGCQSVVLEATAENIPAMCLYKNTGFYVVKTTFKETFLL